MPSTLMDQLRNIHEQKPGLDGHLYLILKLRVVPSGAKSNLLSTGALSTNYRLMKIALAFAMHF